MNIAFYTDSFLPATDGVVTAIRNTSEELQRRGHKVYIFAPGSGGNDSKQENVFYVRGITFKKYPQYSLGLSPFFGSMKMRDLDIDIVHAQTPFTMGMSGMINAKLNKLPLVGSFHTMFTDRAVINEYAASGQFMRNMVKKYSWGYAKFFYSKCNTVIAPSGVIERILHENEINNTIIVENGVDTKRFNPKVSGKSIRSRLIGNNRKLVLYTGRISKEKRLSTLIKAAARLKDRKIMFVAVGTGPALDHYKSMVNRYNLNDKFKFIGFVENKELPKYYAACDAFCIPSTFETQGMVALEAMASGKPVIGADYMALGELIANEKNGEKFIPGDSADCAKKIEKVINNVSQYKEMVKTADGYSVERTTDKLLKAYRDLVQHN